jgi:D-inositol-3-phosphate glycosyltransferase
MLSGTANEADPAISAQAPGSDRMGRVTERRRHPRRVAMLSVHTSPLHQPGTGDAGGMNVYVVELARRLAAAGVEVEIFTRATSAAHPPVVELAPGVLVRHVGAGPCEGVTKEDLPAHLYAFTRGLMRAWADQRPAYYDLLHSHYWLSGHAGRLAAGRWGVPLVHTMHTMAKVKNVRLAVGDRPEPEARVTGEARIVAAADRLIANTSNEAAELIRHYDADAARVAVVHPGVNLDRFRPDASGVEAGRFAARMRLGLPPDALVPLFTGRIQPLKAPDVLLLAIARLLDERPQLRERLVVPVVGGPSGSGLAEPESLQKLAARLGISDVVLFSPPVGQDQLADWYRAASVLVMPSYSESFGLVALEAQACGTPVIAAEVGGLPVAVRNEVSGMLVPGHHPADYAAALGRFADDPALSTRMGEVAARHAGSFGWDTAASATVAVYTAAMHQRPSARARPTPVEVRSLDVFRRRVEQPVRQIAGEGGTDQYPESGPRFVPGDQDDLRAAQRRLGAASGAEGARMQVERAAVGQQVAGAGARDEERGALGGDVGDGDGFVPSGPADPALQIPPAGARAHQQPFVRAQPQRGELLGPHHGVRFEGQGEVQREPDGVRRRSLGVEPHVELGQEGEFRQPDRALGRTCRGGQAVGDVRQRAAERGGRGGVSHRGGLPRGRR